MHGGFSGFSAVLLVLLVRSVRWFGGIVVSGCASRSLLGSYVHLESILNNVNDTNVFCCVWIESPFIYFLLQFSILCYKSSVGNKVQFIVVLLVVIEIVVIAWLVDCKNRSCDLRVIGRIQQNRGFYTGPVLVRL